MKKLTVLFSIFTFVVTTAVFAQASNLYITNHSSCTVDLRLTAHNSTFSSCGSFVSNVISVVPTASISISLPSDLDPGTCLPVCWATGTIGSSGVWDEAVLFIPSVGCSGTIGDPSLSPCFSATNFWSGSPCCNVSASYSIVSGNVYLSIQ